MPRLCCAFLLLLTTTAQAATSQQDYAYQAVLTEADEQLQRIELPVDVILALTQADLSDLAVFNANGKRLPHSVTRAPKSFSDHSLPLPFHEFRRFQQQHSKIVTTREQNQQQGLVSELQTTETIAVQSVRKDYLIELRPEARTPGFDRIELTWKHEPADQILELKVEVGDELDKLRVINYRKSLTNRESEDLGWRSISGFSSKPRYMRLTPINDVTRFELQQVNGHYRQSKAAAKLTHQVSPALKEEESGRFYVFEFPSRVNAEAMQIIPVDAHSVITGNLYASWNNLEQKHSIKYGFRQHNINDDGVKPSKPISLPSRPFDKIWFTSKAELSEVPRVELIYPQYEVIFLGDGNGPYSLAWGNHAGEAGSSDLSQLLEGKLSEAQQSGSLVTLGAVQVAGGPSRLAPQSALPWEKWLLWTLLVLAALVTGRMAYRLYREMNQAQ